MEELRAGDSAIVSNLEPRFSPPGRDDGQPLADTHLSRTPPALVVAAADRGQLEIRPGAREILTEVDGAVLTGPVMVTPTELARGVTIMIARRIVLCLHRVETPIERGPRLGLLGGSDAIERVRQAVSRVADLDVPVLIRGETGTGKEMVARALVDASRRAGKPFIAVNMAAIPATTAAAELFGHERGAFTGAAAGRPGYFGEAANGTLFLDEVGLTPPDVQAMLLRVLEAGEILPLGTARARKVNVRVIAATDADLEAAIASRAFSEPLFHRLAGFQIALPPLRNRREDLGELLRHFLKQELAATGEPDKLDRGALDSTPWLSAAQVAQLAVGRWPGNIRALRNAARQIVIASRRRDRATIDEAVERLAGRSALVADRPPVGSRPTAEASRATPTRTAWEIEPDALLAALRQHHWSPSATAAALRVPRTTLYALMDRHAGIRKANSIPTAELLQYHQEFAGDLDRIAEHLQVSRRGLQLRLAQILQESARCGRSPRHRA